MATLLIIANAGNGNTHNTHSPVVTLTHKTL